MKINYVLYQIMIFVLSSLAGCGMEFEPKKVYTVMKPAIEYKIPTISDKENFLNDLMLSPYWKVEQGRDGMFRARARSISKSFVCFENNTFDMLLFSFKKNKVLRIPRDHIISNESMRGGNTYSSFTVDIIFQKHSPAKDINLYKKGKPIILDIFESLGNEIGPNSYSTFVFNLSQNGDVFLFLREQGGDLDRKITFANIPDILQEIERLNKLPQAYHVKDIYMDFFELRFDDLKPEKSIKRTPGLQDIDTFYGYFKANKNVNYNGINIKISHPLYCNGECTRASSRIRKAEYLGKPYFEDDLQYFQIEDNAVYLVREYNQKFGTFSGTGSFKGKLEIMNKEGKVLYKKTDWFKGWER